MSRDRFDLLDRFEPLFEAPEPSLERFRRRRDRKRRNQRIAAGVVGIAVFVAAVLVVTNLGSLDRSKTRIVPGDDTTGPVTGPAVTGPTYNGPSYTLGPVTDEDIAVGESFAQAWVEGDGEAAAATFSPDGTFDGFGPAILPALHDWFRAGGWTFGNEAGCGVHGFDATRGVVGCSFTYENDLTRALDMRPVPIEISFAIEAATIRTAWFGGGGDVVYNMFGSPDPLRYRPGSGANLFGGVWDMFIEWLSSHYPEDFARMYDPDYGYPVPGYPILDAASIELWERHTDEFVASPQAVADSLTAWAASQSFEVQASRICMTKSDALWQTTQDEELQGPEFALAMAEASEEALTELRALPLETEADRATMDAFIPLAEQWIELFRRAAEGRTDVSPVERRERRAAMFSLIPECFV
jgi:hypothetical protein